MRSAVTRLPRSAPLIHRVAHAYCLAGLPAGRRVWGVTSRVEPIESAAVLIGDAQLELDKTVWLDLAVYHGRYEPTELKLTAKLIHKGDTVSMLAPTLDSSRCCVRSDHRRDASSHSSRRRRSSVFGRTFEDGPTSWRPMSV